MVDPWLLGVDRPFLSRLAWLANVKLLTGPRQNDTELKEAMRPSLAGEIGRAFE